jgi:hypothetical protein
VIRCGKSRSGSGMNIPDHISKSLERIFLVKKLKLLMRIRIQDPGSENMLDSRSRIWDPGRKKFGSGIRDVYPATLATKHGAYFICCI